MESSSDPQPSSPQLVSPLPHNELSDSDNAPRSFSFEDADITFRSSDGVLYGVHRKNLNCCARGFPPPEFNSSKDDIVQMTETSKILDLLFAFMYPNPTPEVEHLPFDVFADLAGASEKFQVFSAMTICKIHMTAAINKHPIHVLRYAITHRYLELLDMVAIVAIEQPLASVVLQLPSHVVISWVEFHQQWQNALTRVYGTAAKWDCGCDGFRDYRCEVLQKLGGKVESVGQLEDIFTMPEHMSKCCSKHINNWREQAYSIRATLPKFSTVLFPKPVTGISELVAKGSNS